MRRVYMVLCPACPIVVMADESRGPWGNDAGLPLLAHIGNMHPELVYTRDDWERLRLGVAAQGARN